MFICLLCNFQLWKKFFGELKIFLFLTSARFLSLFPHYDLVFGFVYLFLLVCSWNSFALYFWFDLYYSLTFIHSILKFVPFKPCSLDITSNIYCTFVLILRLNFPQPKVSFSIETVQCLFSISIHLRFFRCILFTKPIHLLCQVFSIAQLQLWCCELRFILLVFQIPIFTFGIRKVVNCIWQYYSSIQTKGFPYVVNLSFYIESFGSASFFYIHSDFICKLSVSAHRSDHFQPWRF